jgi:hypothetical protein
MRPVAFVLVAACATQVESPVAAPQAPPPSAIWELAYSAWDPLFTGTVVGADGALYTASEGHRRGTALMRGTMTAAGELVWTPFGPPDTDQSLATALGDGDADGDVDLLTLSCEMSGGPPGCEHRVHDQATGAVVKTVPLPILVNTIHARQALVQADADPQPELLVTDAGRARLFDDDGTDLGGFTDTCGLGPYLLEGGGAPQVLMCRGDLLDGATLAVVGSVPLADYDDVAELDADGDGGWDLVVRLGDEWTLLEGPTWTPRWAVQLVEEVRRPVVFDLDGDGVGEVVFPGGEADAGEALVAVDAVTGAELGAVQRPRSALAPAWLGTWDPDGDGTPLLVVGGWVGHTVFEAGSGWGFVAPILPVHHTFPVVGDFMGTGADQVALISSEMTNGRLDVGGFDLAGGRVFAGELHPFAAAEDEVTTGTRADLDGDGDDELVLSGVTGETTVYGLPGTRGGRSVPYLGATVIAADVDGDGVEDLVGYHRSIDALVGGVHRTIVASAAMGGGVIDVAAADLTGDGRAEIIGVVGPRTRSGDAVVWDAATGVELRRLAGAWDEVEVTTTPGGARRIWLQRHEGDQVDVFDVSRGAVTPRGSLTTAPHVWWNSAMRAIGAHLFYSKDGLLHVIDTSTGIDSTLDVRANGTAYEVQPIPGGFVVTGLDRVVAFAW